LEEKRETTRTGEKDPSVGIINAEKDDVSKVDERKESICSKQPSKVRNTETENDWGVQSPDGGKKGKLVEGGKIR